MRCARKFKKKKYRSWTDAPATYSGDHPLVLDSFASIKPAYKLEEDGRVSWMTPPWPCSSLEPSLADRTDGGGVNGAATKVQMVYWSYRIWCKLADSVHPPSSSWPELTSMKTTRSRRLLPHAGTASAYMHPRSCHFVPLHDSPPKNISVAFSPQEIDYVWPELYLICNS